MMERLVILLVIILPATLCLDCNGPAEIVIAVPGSEAVPDAEFQHLENFLIGLFSYFTISASNTRVGLVLYGREPVVISNLGDAPTRQSLNTRITILSQRATLANQISGGQNVPKAIDKVRDMLVGGRAGVPKIGIIMTYGSTDLTSTDPTVVNTAVTNAATSAKAQGIALLATSTGGEVPGYANIPNDKCGEFDVSSYSSGLTLVQRFLASAICYVLDPAVNPQPAQSICFPEVLGQIQGGILGTPFAGCAVGDILKADPNNCAYFYQCPPGVRKLCAPGALFDTRISNCNHKESVACFSDGTPNALSCPAPTGLFNHPTDRSKFLNCFIGIPYVQSCPSGLVFNSAKDYCDYPANVPSNG